MKRHYGFRVILTFSLILCFFSFSACSKAPANEEEVPMVNNSIYTVTFDLNGGDGQASSQEVKYGEFASRPTDITKDNCTLKGWDFEGEIWSFTADAVTSDMTLTAIWKWDCSYVMNSYKWGYSIPTYYEQRFEGSSDWHMVSSYSTRDVTGYVPIEMGGSGLFPKSDIMAGVVAGGSSSSYGGCGPIATMGILDYFARYLGYTAIMANPTNSNDRIKLATDVIANTKTYELADGATTTFPWDSVSGFNAVIKKCGLENVFKADYIGSINTVDNSVKYLSKIIECVNNGIPATMYMGVNTGEGSFSEHIVNVYEYQKWQGKDKDGNELVKYALNCRLNWGYSQSTNNFCDADLLGQFMCGIIYYEMSV